MWKRVTTAIVVALLRGCDGVCPDDRQRQGPPVSSHGRPQAAQPTHPDTGVTDDTGETRPATTTFMGDTGLWFVPTGEVLPAKRWSFSVYRVNFDYNQGFTDVSNWPVTFGVGLGDRAELFGAVHAVRRIDRDVRPLFFTGRPARAAWSTTIRSSRRAGRTTSSATSGSAPRSTYVAVASSSRWPSRVRGMIKLPTAKDDEEGVGTGKPDFAVDAIVSKEINERVELSGFGGFIVPRQPGRRRAVERVPLGLRRGLPDAQEPAADRGTARRGVLRRHGRRCHRHSLIGDDGSLSPPAISSTRFAGQRLDRPDLAGHATASSPAPA